MPHRIKTLFSLAVMTASATATVAHAGPSGTYQRQAVRATNDVREAHGLRVLRRDDCLTRRADAHARRMAARDDVFHQDLGIVLRACHLDRVAENVAVGYRTGRATVRSGWMRSASHRTNLLTRGHRVTGVGAVRDDRGVWWTVQLLGAR